ncbi:MAG: metallophosphoesterase family protein [Akkermansia sp.]|nr:metallophosphoesterase family protein [Akkermansia sp.]
MLVALLSDIHDHDTHLLLALHAAKEKGCTHLLFMGDMAELSTFRTLREEWAHPIDLVFGNNEYECTSFARMAAQCPQTTLHGTQASLELDGRKLFFCHLPRTAIQAAGSGQYDAVFYGHTHTPAVSIVGDQTLLVNPGEVYGRQNAPTIGVYDTTSNTARIIPI